MKLIVKILNWSETQEYELQLALTWAKNLRKKMIGTGKTFFRVRREGSSATDTKYTFDPIEKYQLSALGVNIVELNSEDYFLSGHPAGRIVMTATSPNGTSKVMALASIVNGGLYAISYLADTTTYNQYLPDAQTIVDTFKIISSQ